MILEYLLNEGAGPEAESKLAAYSPARFHHSRLHQRAPDGIHKLSLRQVWPAFKAALDSAGLVLKEKPFLAVRDPSWEESCLERIEHLLYVLAEYLNECDIVLRCCFPNESTFKQSEHVDHFRKVIRPYRDRVGAAVNAIKHNQGRLRLFALYDHALVVSGYFVEGVLSSGAVGPNSNIHNDKTSQAFSFAFDLRLHFLSVFLISRNLSSAVERILGPPDLRLQPGGSSAYAREVGEKLMRYSRGVFPDEMRLGFAEVSVDRESSTLRIEYPASTAPDTFRSGPIHHWVSFVVADGTTGAFVPPYAPSPLRVFTVELTRSVLDRDADKEPGD